MKINLNDLANDLAKTDNPDRLNITAAHAKAVLGALGRKLRSISAKKRKEIFEVIRDRAGLEESQ